MEGKAAQSQRRSTLRSTTSKSRTNPKPFSDLTNTISQSQSQSSPPIVVASTKPKPKPSFQPKSKPSPNPTTTTSASGSAAEPSTPPPPPRPSTPPGGDDNDDVFEIHTVYTRKKTANKRKGKKKTLVVPFGSYSADRVVNAGHKRNEYKDMGLEPHTVPRKKKRRAELKEETSSHALQDYIEQQRAYFNEIDAFELPEEEVGSDNESD